MSVTIVTFPKVLSPGFLNELDSSTLLHFLLTSTSYKLAKFPPLGKGVG